MPSNPTTRNRLEKQAVGENVNTWGDKLNQTGLDLIDEAMDGVEPIAIASTAVTLTSNNYASDQARNRVLVFTGALTGNTTVTVPSVEKFYEVDDQTARAGFTLTLKTSGGSGYALRPGPQQVYCDAIDVRRGTPRMDQLPLPAAAVDMNAQRLTNLPTPSVNSDAATKKYVDDTAFNAAAGNLPGQVGSAGYFLTTNGSVAGWAPAPVLSFSGRTGAIAPQAGDYTPALVGAVGQGRHTIWVPSAAMVPRITNGAGYGAVETSTNKIVSKTLDFDPATIEYAQFAVRMPKSWNEGTVTAVITWSHASTTTNFGVVWGLQGAAVSDGDALDAAFGTPQTVTDTGGIANTAYLSPETAAITIAGNPAAEDVVIFQLYRAATAGADTMAIDARLHGATLYYTVDAATDA